MAAQFDSIFVVGSRLKPLRFRLEHENGAAIDLSGHTVTLTMIADADSTVRVNAGVCTIDQPTPGPGVAHGYYPWSAADMTALVAGDYWAYFRRTSGGGLWADLPEGPDAQNRGRGCKIKFVTAG
jgi:hypothetical protein